MKENGFPDYHSVIVSVITFFYWLFSSEHIIDKLRLSNSPLGFTTIKRIIFIIILNTCSALTKILLNMHEWDFITNNFFNLNNFSYLNIQTCYHFFRDIRHIFSLLYIFYKLFLLSAISWCFIFFRWLTPTNLCKLFLIFCIWIGSQLQYTYANIV